MCTFDSSLGVFNSLDLPFAYIMSSYKFLISQEKKLIVISCNDLHVFEEGVL